MEHTLISCLFEQFSANINEDDSIDYRDQDPGNGIGYHQAAQRFVMRKDHKDPTYTQTACSENSRDCRFDGMTETAQGTGNRIHDRTQKITAHHKHKPFHAPADNLWIGIIQTEQRSSE